MEFDDPWGPNFASHRRRVCDQVLSLPIVSEPKGWQATATRSIGGLEYIGFSRRTNLLVTVSSQYLALIDPATNIVVAKEIDSTSEKRVNESQLICCGFGPIEGELVNLAGIGGGGLPLTTPSGECLALAAPLYPGFHAIFNPAGCHFLISGREDGCVVVRRDFISLCGFSWSGDAFVIVDTDLHMWTRKLTQSQ